MIGAVTSKNGKEIRVTEERWSHIVEAHDYMAGNQDMVFEILENPYSIIDGGKGELIAIRHFVNTSISEKHSVVIHKEQTNDGFVITAFMTSKPEKIVNKGVIWNKPIS